MPSNTDRTPAGGAAMKSHPDAQANAITRDELEAVVGKLDDEKVIDILNLQPTSAEMEQAILWAGGDGDLLAKSGHPLTAKVAELVES
jgi:hypothetical protein